MGSAAVGYKERPRKDGLYLAASPDEDDGRDAESGLGIPVGVFYEMEVHVRRVVLVLDGPRDGVGCGQVGRIIVDESLDDWKFPRPRS